MAKQLTDLNEILGNFVGDGDYLLIRDMSDKEDKKIKVEELGNALFLAQHRVGSVYITYSEDDDPNLRGGSWQLAAQGRAIIGVDPEDPDFDAADKTGGAKTHTLTVPQLPNVSGSWTLHGEENGSIFYNKTGYATGITHSGQNKTIGSTAGAYSQRNPGFNFGDNKPHNNLHPYETAFVWRRIG